MKVILLILLSILFGCHFRKTSSKTQSKNIKNDTIYSKNIENDTIYDGNEWEVKPIEIDTLIIRGKDTAIVNRLETYGYKDDNSIYYTYLGYYKKDINPEFPDYKNIIPVRKYIYRKGKLVYESFHFSAKDSMIYGRDIEQCDELEIRYDEKGNIIRRTCNGLVSNEGISANFAVGTAYVYKDNKLVKELYFHNAKRGDDYILHKIYNGKGGYKEIYTNNYMLYENDSIVLSPKEIKRRIKTKK